MNKLFGFILLVLGALGSCTSSFEIIEDKFENAGITFSTNIYKPQGQGPFPAVVIVHGSKNHTKDFYTEYSEYFAENGIVTLNYDNRGHGSSEGNLWTSTFQNLGSDATAAVEHLKTLDYVDSNKIGLWADSHGGWIVLIADSLSDNIDFIISKSGPSVTPLKTVYFDVENNYLNVQKTPNKEKGRILNMYPMIFEYLTKNRSDSLWNQISNNLEYFEPTPYFKNSFDEYYKELLLPPDKIAPINEIQIAPSGRDYDFDPKPYLENLKTRMLLIYGTSDKLIPTSECIKVVENIQNPNIDLKVYEGADHGMRIQRKPDILFTPKFPDGYLEGLVEFIKE